MKKIVLFFLLPLLALASCRTLRVRDYHTASARIAEPLPRLGFLAHQESFSRAFDRETFDKGWNGNVVVPNRYTSDGDLYVLSDLPLEDAFTYMGNEVSDNLAETTGPKYGHVRFKLVHYDRRTPGWGYSIGSVSTLFIPNLVGMPYNRVRAELELQVEIADANKKVLARYRAPGTGRAYVAMYYGYRPADAWRKANLLAMKNAMATIRPQILADADRLRMQLLEAGPVKK